MSQNFLSQGGLSLDRLHNFCIIADAGSLTKAAGGDPGKMSLFSRQIKELEAFFGVELKRRHGKGMVLTDAGRQLAQLTRAHLLGLEDFHRTARQMPKQISIAAGNSVLEWLILPQVAELRKNLSGVALEFYSQRTSETIGKLQDLSLDIGIVREDSVERPLVSKRLRLQSYSLFIPKALARGITPANLRARLPEIPIATSAGGQFREGLERLASKAKWKLKIEVSCSSYTQAARTVHAGACAAILPDIAASEFEGSHVLQIPLPFLKPYSRQLCVAWNPRLIEVRPFIVTALTYLETRLALT